MSKHPQFTPRSRNAFSLIELLTVVAIISLLSAILIPAVNTVRRHALTAKTLSNLKQWGVAILLYTNDHNGYLPGPTFANIDKWVNLGRVNQSLSSDVANRRTTLFSYLFPYVQEGWQSILTGNVQYVMDISECPVTKEAGDADPVQHFMRTAVANKNTMVDPFGYYNTDPTKTTLPVSLMELQESHGRGLECIPSISNLDKQNSSAGSSDGNSPARAVHAGRRAYLFFDGHTELIEVPPDAKPGTQIVKGYAN